MSDQPITTEIQRLRAALECAETRFAELAEIVRDLGSYDNAGFLQASADRCRRVLEGGEFNG